MQTVCNCLSMNVFSCLVNFLLLSLSFQPSPSFKSMFSLRIASSSARTTFTSLFCTLLYFLSLLHCTSCTPPFPVEVPPLMLYSLISSPCLANWANFAQRVLCHVRDCTFRRAVHFICIFLTQTWTDVWFSPPILLLACRDVFSSVCTFHYWLLNWSCSTKLILFSSPYMLLLLVEKCLVTVYLLVEKCSHQFAPFTIDS